MSAGAAAGAGAGVRILHGDCRAVLPTLEAASVHCVVTDPPYHLTGMERRLRGITAADADKNFTKRAPGQAKSPFAAMARGFMGHAWDGGDVAFRPETWAAVCRVLKPGGFMAAFASSRGYHRMTCAIEDAGFVIHPMLGWLTGGGFPKATRFRQPELAGWRYGLQALKPALEPICLAQKPLEGTGSANWDAHGCGGLNIDGCKIGTGDDRTSGGRQGSHPAPMNWGVQTGRKRPAGGRWPANLAHDGSTEVMEAFAAFGKRRAEGGGPKLRSGAQGVCYGGLTAGQAKAVYADTGTAARFFYSAKATTAERAGSKHPTVKPAALMRWLVTLVCPPGGVVLDPFAGTGSTGLAADQLGMGAVLIEQDAGYVAAIRRKLGHDAGLFTRVQEG